MAKGTEKFTWGTGRRKTSVARVRLAAGSGKIVVNKKPLNEYFTTLRERAQVLAPLVAIKAKTTMDVIVNATGGGFAAQADAISLGIARAILKSQPDHEATLREGRFLTRDAREVERKKPGRPGARKSFQFSKR